MSENGDERNRSTNVRGRETAPDPSASELKSLDADPDLDADLGYELIELDVVRTNNGSGDVLLLPADEDLLKEDAFVVADAETVCDVSDWC
ncbi:hypothetical protein [Halostella salina]|uniref:hypothetical protein n=1 Tax=Halostella salina TaxID=1547897 RepID=UPI001F088826|nr:hypothetical protein [Halostella salina]